MGDRRTDDEQLSSSRPTRGGAVRAMVLLLGGIVAAAAAAIPVSAADRGLQFPPTGNRVLASKDVGNERWAITLNKDDNTVTGNVFLQGGGDPSFIACTPLAQENSFACFGADACSEAGAQRGIQVTPNDEQILVNKDVGNERWAITLNDDDGTVTGNVFRQGGGDPSFIACTPLAAANSFACSGADACLAEPCSDQFTFIANVTLPPTFFEVPVPCSEQFSFIRNVTLPANFFQLEDAGSFVSSVETSTGTQGTLRVGAAPIPGSNPPAPIGGVQGDTNVNPGGTNDLTISLNGAAASVTDAATTAQSQGLSLVLAIADQTCTPGNFVSGWYEIPLLTASGQVSITLSFPEGLSGDTFVLCLTTINNGVVGQYFVLEQNPSACGNQIRESGEACDPPAAQSQCATGELCSNNCLQCVPATSCAGRCCPGRDDTCTAEGAPCFCDEFCVTAQDCCQDALGECGFGSAAPTISNLTQDLRQRNTSSCNLGGGRFGSLFVAEFDFTDPDGDVTTANSVVDVAFQFSPSGNPGSGTAQLDPIGGNASAGTIQVGQCYRFGNDTSVRVTITLRDDAGNPSNSLSVTTSRPADAN